ESKARTPQRKDSSGLEQRPQAVRHEVTCSLGELPRLVPLEQPVECHRFFEHYVDLDGRIAQLDGELACLGEVGQRALVTPNAVARDATALEQLHPTIEIRLIDVGEGPRVEKL